MGEAADDRTAEAARAFLAFARLEARGRSAAYEALAQAAAGEPGIVGFVAGLPADKRQPNLLFAAARYPLGAPATIGSLADLARRSPGELAAVLLARRTQTNEPGSTSTRSTSPATMTPAGSPAWSGRVRATGRRRTGR